MKLPKLVAAVVLALGASLGASLAVGAQGLIELNGGAVTVTKLCGPGITGTAVFDLTVSLGTQSQTLTGVEIDCGDKWAEPAHALIAGMGLKFHETDPPTGAVAAADKTVSVTTSDQTATIVNNPPASGGLSIQKVCPTGFTGTATFTAKFFLADSDIFDTSSVSVPCGGTTAVTIPVGFNFANSTYTVHESTAALGTKTAADQSGDMDVDAQTITFTDTAAAGPSGAFSINKTCATGVTGSASFSVTVTPVGATAQTVTQAVECGSTTPVGIPAAVALVGAAVTVHETTPPTHGIPASDVTGTLSADAQTVTIHNAAATGALKIQKTCASGVSGNAVFAVTVTPPDGVAAEISVSVPCGQVVTVAVPAASNVIGSDVKIHESTPPNSGIAAADVSTTLTVADQTLTINNGAIAVLPQTGHQFEWPSLPVLFLGLLLALVGLWMAFVWGKIVWRSDG
jgi:hypothetical protein